MKTYVLLFIILSTSSIGYPQTKKDLQEQVTALTLEKQKLMDDILNLKQQIIDLKTEVLEYKNENGRLQTEITKSNSARPDPSILPVTTQNANTLQTSSGRCQAITANGTQCTRHSEPGSKYCWQHRKTYEPESTSASSSKSSSVSSSSNAASSSYGGRTIYTGPRGGKYYINKNGNKTYIKK
jgi:colicin import membrane protein